ncbi:ATP-binding protein [Pseudoalteromonas phenolica]|uniref:histidine kinase n=1 Tax=Pseudoalteromonas phenolica TaxID=161398 RepID=A0A0S2K7D3_9GAMM|nr:ATP-binding protein [Pseudoalteromonas phenolica]ALO44037.1 Signal transduction histidine kinase [Pseudoalteromonas phenolica]MBE0357014.1 histidine kinase [Pseudoalteromonas phenolica O-BC30]
MEDTIPYIKTNHSLIITCVNNAAECYLEKSLLLHQPIGSVFNANFDVSNSIKTIYQGKVISFSKHKINSGFCFVFNISDDEVDEQLDFLNSAIENSCIGVWGFNIDTKKVYLSDIARDFLGLTQSQNVSWRKLLSFVHKEDRPQFPIFFENHINLGAPLQFDFKLSQNNDEKWLALKGSLCNRIKDKWINGTIQDCTIEKLAILSLNDANESKQLAIEAGKIGTWRSTKKNNEWLWNWDSQANNIFKMTPQDIGNINKWIERLHPADKDRVLKALEHSLMTGAEFREHYRGILNNNELIYVFAQGRVGTDQTGKHCRIDGVCIDQTETLTAQKALKELNTQLESRVIERTKELHKTLEKAEHANKIKSEFLSMISHELRTPLNGIVGSLDLLSHISLGSESRELVTTASTSANHLISILNDILDLNKIEAGKLELETVSFDISKLLNEVISTFSASAKEKGIQLKVYEHYPELRMLKGDENRFRQILLNILGNAIKFTNAAHIQHKEITIYTSILFLNAYQAEVKVQISDTGIGMTKETLSRLFTPFTQAEKSTTRKFGGTGLGLSICGKLIDLMGGQILVESKLHIGSQFTIKAPFWMEVADKMLVDKDKLSLLHLDTPSENSNYLHTLIDNHFETTHCEDIDRFNSATRHTAHSVILASDLSTLIQICAKLEHNPCPLILVEPSIRHEASIALSQFAIHANQPVTLSNLKKLLKDLAQDELTLENLDLDLDLDNLDIEVTDPLEANPPSEKASNTVINTTNDVLLVEDNPLNQKLLKSQLARLGVNCDVANNGEEGLYCWRNGHYKLILTDCHMPEIDGYEMTRLIRTEEAAAEREPIPIIAVSGAVMKGEKALCTSIGMSDFLSKPVKLCDIKQIMERWYE